MPGLNERCDFKLLKLSLHRFTFDHINYSKVYNILLQRKKSFPTNFYSEEANEIR